MPPEFLTVTDGERRAENPIRFDQRALLLYFFVDARVRLGGGDFLTVPADRGRRVL